MLWSVASARNEISLRKWSVQMRSLVGALVAKMRFVGSNASAASPFLGGDVHTPEETLAVRQAQPFYSWRDGALDKIS